MWMRYNIEMISVFEKYVLKTMAVATFVTALSLTLIILLTQSIRYLELVISSDASVTYFLVMIGLAIPKFLEAILPLAFTIGCIYTVRRLMSDREIIIMSAAGASFINISRIFIIFAFVMMAFQFILSGWISPYSVAQLQETRSEIKSHYATLLFREGVFNTLGNGLTAYVEKREGLNEIKNLMIHDNEGSLSEGKKTTIVAKRGIVNLNDDRQQLLVYDGTQYIQDNKTNKVNQLDFQQYSLDIPMAEDTLINRWQKPEERTFDKLFISESNAPYIDISKKSEFVAEIHERLSTPLLYLAFIICIIAFLFLGNWNRRVDIMPIIKAGACIIVIQIGHIVIYDEARSVPLLNIGMYLIALIPILYGAYYIYRYHKVT